MDPILWTSSHWELPPGRTKGRRASGVVDSGMGNLGRHRYNRVPWLKRRLLGPTTLAESVLPWDATPTTLCALASIRSSPCPRASSKFVLEEQVDVSEYPIGNFDSLLRDLLTYDLVEQNAEQWLLRPEAARRLSEIALNNRQGARISVYVGYLCEGCRSAGVTVNVDGKRLCNQCVRTLRTPDERIAPAPRHDTPRDRTGAPPNGGGVHPAGRRRPVASTVRRPGPPPRHAVRGPRP